MRRLLLAAMAVLPLCACDATPSKPSRSTANAVAANLRYIQDQQTDLCYAVLGSHAATGNSDTSITITWVPCEAKVLQAIGK